MNWLELKKHVKADPDWRAFEQNALQILEQRKSADLVVTGSVWKFLDTERWLIDNLCRMRRIIALDSPPLRILDMGTGTGIFPYLCGKMGHDATGLDVPDMPKEDAQVFALRNLLRIKTLTGSIKAQKPIEISGEYDLVTAFMTTFNRFWTFDDWIYLFRDLKKHMSPEGRIHLQFNTMEEYEELLYQDQETLDFFKANAEIEHERVTLPVSKIS